MSNVSLSSVINKNETVNNLIYSLSDKISLHEIFDWIKNSPFSTLIIDLGQVTSIHSNLLVALAKAHQQARELNKTIALTSVSPEWNVVLEISKLDGLFLFLLQS